MAHLIAQVDINKYEQAQEKSLGEGHFGEVFLYKLKQGEDSDNGIEQMAVKQVIADEKNIDDLRKEVYILCQLQHPNIVLYLGEHVEGQFIQILMEYLPAWEKKTKRYTRDVLDGLRYLHGKKTIHRDIKGANILIDGEDRAKLADFGLSKIMETNKSAHTFAGTPLFMSPEMIQTKLDHTGHGLKTDIWSIGCVVVQMLSMYPPWKDKCDARISKFKLMQVIAACTHPEYTLPVIVSQEAKDFINKCFVIQPKDRPSADDLLQQDSFLAV